MNLRNMQCLQHTSSAHHVENPWHDYGVTSFSSITDWKTEYGCAPLTCVHSPSGPIITNVGVDRAPLFVIISENRVTPLLAHTLQHSSMSEITSPIEQEFSQYQFMLGFRNNVWIL